MASDAPSLDRPQPSQLNEVSDPNATLVGQARPAIPIEPTAPPRRRWVPDPDAPENKTRPRTLVLCFDGTGDQFDDDNSNVVNFVTLLKKDDHDHQLVYYQTGIGTYTKSSSVSPLVNQMARTLDEMFAWNLGSHVQDGYEFLMQNYSNGDKISIFGFSRGAYTARALAGMIQKVGLLPTCNSQQIPFAWALYNREDLDGLKLSIAFKKAFSMDVKIDFVGVWDTVASVGITNRELPFVGNNHAIRVFRHAIALDEHRAKFMPNFYHAIQTETTVVATGPAAAEAPGASANGAPKMHRHRSESQAWEEAINAQCGITTDALEVWFAGAHCDVGGGSVTNDTRYALARIPLRWMIRECFRMKSGIIFDSDIMKELGLDPATVYPNVLPRLDRIPAPSDAVVQSPGSQPYVIVSLLKFIGSVVWIPVDILLSVAVWPFKHLWLLVRYSEPVKWLRWKLGIKPSTTPAVQDVPDVIIATRPTVDTVNEEEEELKDALSPIYDQLHLAWWWWIIECLPLKHRSQKGERADYYVRSNFGKGRKIYGDARSGGLKIHRSVKTRLEVVDKKKDKSAYRPLAWFRYRKHPEGKKLEGPETWNIDHPDPHHQWEWVE
ncbi:hypothetical protein BD410DRAFT_761386 [Rickenella mellea]|uniref:T6SS Phospholipase effector Tle1-like catalytic domain-containing protein n=1 Tax=Rickenella mellea TaxID=50990 RepID=A0A4Y7QMI2_9AGAM|nr:hypothetical protein BD410DRAFT_761386 [Rickenella mellea]